MLTKSKIGLSRVSKIQRRLKLGIHTYTHPLPPLPRLANLPACFRSDPLDQPPRALPCVIIVIFIIFIIDNFIYL